MCRLLIASPTEFHGGTLLEVTCVDCVKATSDLRATLSTLYSALLHTCKTCDLDARVSDTQKLPF